MALSALATTGAAVLPKGIDAVRIFWFRDNPVELVQYRLKLLPPSKYVSGIKDALDNNDPELAGEISSLAADQGVKIPHDLKQRIAAEQTWWATTKRVGADVWHGVTTGRADTGAGFAAALASDMTFIGDARDLLDQAVKGTAYDPLTVGIAAAGIVSTLATLASGGLMMPERVGISILKTVRKTGKFSGELASQLRRIIRKAVDVNELEQLVRETHKVDVNKLTKAEVDEIVSVAKNVVRRDAGAELLETGRSLQQIAEASGTRAAFATLGKAQSLGEIPRLEKVAEGYTKTYRGVLRLLPDAGRRVWKMAKLLNWLLRWISLLVIWSVSAAWMLLRLIVVASRLLRLKAIEERV